MILKVARLGFPVLRAAARELSRKEIRSAEVQRLIDDMIATMYEYEGVGLAAPQVHLPLRLAVLDVPDADERSRERVPLTVLVNPVVTPLSDELLDDWEGCLSIPGLRGQVSRWRRVRLEALDRDAKPYGIEAEEFHARVIQHECDHLDGGVYLDRMVGLRTLSFNEEWERHHAQPHGEDADGE